MRRAAIVCPRRTAVGAFGGQLRPVPVEKLGAILVKTILDETGVDPAKVDDVIIAQSYANSETPCVGRWIALEAGLPVTVPGMQVDRRCGGGLQAIINACMMVQCGAANVVLAGGVESMSNIEYYSTSMRWGARAGTVGFFDRLDRGRERSQPEWRFGRISGMIETAEKLARIYGISREEADAFALRSHRRASAAWASGAFDTEVVPVPVTDRKGNVTHVARDEGVRHDASAEAMARLRPIMADGTVTAGNAAQQNDAAALCLVVAEEYLEDMNLRPQAFLKDWSVAGCEPDIMGIGPVPAVGKLLGRNGLTMDDFDLVEINEAFACQLLSVLKELDWWQEEKLNVNGSGISLGHPVGATGARIAVSMLHELDRRRGRLALETMCIGGGQGLAAIFERPTT